MRIWRQESFVRIEAEGVAEENGAAGGLIRVRLLKSNTDDPAAREELAGIVRGPANVELQP